MEKLVQFEQLASENLTIAESDKKLAKTLKILAKSELEKSKAMTQLVKKELQLTKIREEVAVNMKDLVEEKMKLKEGGILKFSDEELRKEIKLSINTGKIAIIQKFLAEDQQVIADLEGKIADSREKYARDSLNFAKKRVDLSKKIIQYVNAVKDNLPDKQITKAKKGCEMLQQELIKDKKKSLIIEEEIKNLEKELADSEKELSLKFSELEAIRNT